MFNGVQKDKRGRLVCQCGGYWFPHRKGGGACEHSKTCDIHRAKRQDDPTVLLDAILDYEIKNAVASFDPCPF